MTPQNDNFEYVGPARGILNAIALGAIAWTVILGATSPLWYKHVIACLGR